MNSTFFPITPGCRFSSWFSTCTSSSFAHLRTTAFVEISSSRSLIRYSSNIGLVLSTPSVAFSWLVLHDVFMRDGCNPKNIPISTVSTNVSVVLRKYTPSSFNCGMNVESMRLNSCMGLLVVILVMLANFFGSVCSVLFLRCMCIGVNLFSPGGDLWTKYSDRILQGCGLASVDLYF